MNLPNRASDAGPEPAQPPTIGDLLEEAREYIRDADDAQSNLEILGFIDFAIVALTQARGIVRAQLGSPVSPPRELGGAVGTGVKSSSVQSLVLPTNDNSGAQGQPAAALESDMERARR